MAFSFLDSLKKRFAKPQKNAAAASPPAPAAPPPPRVEKRSNERLSKTVLPTATRAAMMQDSFELPAPVSPVTATAAIPATISPTIPSAPRSVAFSLERPPTEHHLPPAVARALAPEVERVISLELSEVAPQVPQGWIRPISEAESGHRVLLKAAELEKGMSKGRPSVSLTSIYHQVPEIFLRPVPEAEATQVTLPIAKVLEEIAALQPRADQQRDQVVPQVETPFLRVTLEDNSKFGTKTGPVETSVHPPVKVHPAVAETIAAAEPEPVVREKIAPAPVAPPPVKPASAPAPIRVKLPLDPERKAEASAPTAPAPVPAPATPPSSTAPAPTRIPFKLSPIGTDAPASERVPASSGPSVPTSLPTGKPLAFSLKPKTDEWLTKDNFAPNESSDGNAPVVTPSVPKQDDARKVSLKLKPILQSLPPFQLTGDISSVRADEKIEFPFSLVEPQLANGKVAIEPDDFAAALPAAYKSLFTAEQISTPVTLPLQEVLANLPGETLRMRDDQVEQEKGSDFETPFSAKAQEDAKRFNVPPAVAAAATPTVAPNESSSSEAEATPAPDKDIDVKAALARLSKMPGVKACAVMFADGLSLAGNLPEEYEADGLCAMAPSFLQRIENHMTETQLGVVRSMTLFCTKAAVTFFMDENLCLAALHTRELSAEVRADLERALHELSQKYSHAA